MPQSQSVSGYSYTFLIIFRLAEVRQELPPAVDELPAAGPQKGPVLPAGRGPHHFAPQNTGQQVIDMNISAMI
jgi:hypothetical protein